MHQWVMHDPEFNYRFLPPFMTSGLSFIHFLDNFDFKFYFYFKSWLIEEVSIYILYIICIILLDIYFIVFYNSFSTILQSFLWDFVFIMTPQLGKWKKNIIRNHTKFKTVD